MTSTLRMAEPRNADAPAWASTLSVPVLVVDDNPAKRLALTSVLGPLDYTIVEADSGVAALRCITAQDFAVILLDVRMPIMDGIETAALIRRRRQSEMTPIIFITAHANDEAVSLDRYAAGAVDFIFAPVVPEELRAKVSVFANLFLRAQELADQARSVRKDADQLRLLTDAAPVGIFQTDAHNDYVYTNPRWTEITGMSAEDAVGRTWDIIIDAEQRSSLLAEIADGGTGGSELSYRFELRATGAEPRVVLVTARSIPDTMGGRSGWVGTLADVTAETGAELAMSHARDEATEASRLKSDFLANMSHEIRTPMNGVIGMTDLLLETDLDDRQRDYAQTVRNSGEALLTIINDILDFSKVEAGMLEIENIEFNVQGVVDDVVDLLAGPAQAKGLELIAMVESSVPALVMGDPGRVRQVLTNLIANAVKFTQAGEIVVRVTRVDTETDGGEAVVRFDVSDTGDGIAPDKLDTIFQPFVQADTSTSRKYGGTGLGLAISVQLVALMAGDCGVLSQLGEGSLFWFTIRVQAESTLDNGVAVPETGLSGARALIVDDNASLRDVLSNYLTEWDVKVDTAASAAGALAELRRAETESQRFAVVLLDQSMPGMEGPDLKKALVRDPTLAGRLVLMTGLGQERDVGDAAALGALTALSKPVHRKDLLTCLRVVLGFEGAEPGPAEAAAPRPSRVGERRLGRLLLAEDNLINQKVAVAILSNAGYLVDTVLNGAAAVDAVSAQPYDAILMDCQMPVMNGYEATAAIRAQGGSTGMTPIIAMTAGARREDQERCMAEGMDSYLAKPVSKDALLALVSRSVRKSRR